MKLVPLSNIFDIEYGNQFDLNKLEVEDGDINLVTRSRNNLGVSAKVQRYNDVEPNPGGLITVTLGGTYLLSAFIQQDKFYTAQNIKVLKPKKKMSFEEKLFYCVAISKNRFKYTSHGREANSTFDSILVPREVSEKWRKLNVKQLDNITASAVHKNTISLNTSRWKTFQLLELFRITGTTTTPASELFAYGEGKYPYVTTQASNNGVESCYDFYSEEGGVLTVDSAVLGYCSFQPDNFSASDHVEKLIPTFNMNKYIALFLTAIINREQYRYNYGRKCSQQRLKQSSIKLPVNKAGHPDWQYMENYSKSLPYSSAL